MADGVSWEGVFGTPAPTDSNDLAMLGVPLRVNGIVDHAAALRDGPDRGAFR